LISVKADHCGSAYLRLSRNRALDFAMGSDATVRRPFVVLVDDDPHVLQSLQFAFEVDGFDVLAFANAEDLLARPPIEGAGCLVLDYQLGGINGLSLLERLRERGCRLPAVMITTPSGDLIARAGRVGVGVIEKPLLCDTLVSEVRRLMDRRQL
jgi:FixJ family two-component response regulator